MVSREQKKRKICPPIGCWRVWPKKQSTIISIHFATPPTCGRWRAGGRGKQACVCVCFHCRSTALSSTQAQSPTPPPPPVLDRDRVKGWGYSRWMIETRGESRTNWEVHYFNVDLRFRQRFNDHVTDRFDTILWGLSTGFQTTFGIRWIRLANCWKGELKSLDRCTIGSS